MKLHYMGKFNLDPDSLPQAEHKPGAVEFKEADSMKKLSVIANTVACIILVILGAAAFFRIVPVAEPKSATITWFAALLGSIVIIFPHELLHAACFKRDFELGKPQQIEVPFAAARAAKREVGLPRLFVIALHPPVELEGADLRERIIHIVERVEEDMLLLHPETALLEELVAVIISPWHIGQL